MPTYQITIPDSVEWHEETLDPPYRQVSTKIGIYSLYLDLLDDEDSEELEWVPTIYDNVSDCEVFASAGWDLKSDDLETAKEEILVEALRLLHMHLVDDFGAVEISDDSIDTESGIDSLDLEN